MRGNVAAILLVLVGLFFLLNNLGLIDISLWELVRAWWPLVLIGVVLTLFFAPDSGRRI